jgi:hypothetical protein
VKAFISYAAADRAWARQFRRHLGDLGVEAWIDEDEIFPGDNFLSIMGNALASSDALLVLVSPASVRSEFLQRELQFAFGSERFENRIVPVIVEPTDEMPWMFRRFKTVSGPPAEAARQVAAILSATAPEGSTARAHSR